MPLRLLLALLVIVTSSPVSGQALGVLRITVVLTDVDGSVTPVSRHALLISDDPQTVETRRVLTTREGTITVRLKPGHYTVESDEPLPYRGKAYRWVERLSVGTGETRLEFTADNARVEDVSANVPDSARRVETDPSFLLQQWRDSIVAIWTPTTRGTGFLVDTAGLVVTNERVIASAASVEVQLTPALKVGARVLEADASRDAAVLWIDPASIAGVRPVPLDCGSSTKAAIEDGQEVIALSAPLRGEKRLAFGRVSRIAPQTFDTDVRLAAGGGGGPVFSEAGHLVGLTTVERDVNAGGIPDARGVRADQVCEAVAAARTKLPSARPPEGVRLPVEPPLPFPPERLDAIVRRRAGSLKPYETSSAEFDIALITPVHTYGARDRRLMDFGPWTDYVEDYPAVLLVRVTPRMVESFWTTVGRAAARTQGMALPPITRAKAGFSRLRLFCGDTEVMPIHPFTLERQVSQRTSVSEGLYVVHPDALTPACGTVTLVLYSEKEPGKGDSRTIDAGIVRQVWTDFEDYRRLVKESAGTPATAP